MPLLVDLDTHKLLIYLFVSFKIFALFRVDWYQNLKHFEIKSLNFVLNPWILFEADPMFIVTPLVRFVSHIRKV